MTGEIISGCLGDFSGIRTALTNCILNCRSMAPRRFLPSISLLSAFESVLRTGSTAAAARELDLTQSTVSRLVQNL